MDNPCIELKSPEQAQKIKPKKIYESCGEVSKRSRKIIKEPWL